jgi:hypothetical protein
VRGVGVNLIAATEPKTPLYVPVPEDPIEAGLAPAPGEPYQLPLVAMQRARHPGLLYREREMLRSDLYLAQHSEAFAARMKAEEERKRAVEACAVCHGERNPICKHPLARNKDVFDPWLIAERLDSCSTTRWPRICDGCRIERRSVIWYCDLPDLCPGCAHVRRNQVVRALAPLVEAALKAKHTIVHVEFGVRPWKGATLRDSEERTTALRGDAWRALASHCGAVAALANLELGAKTLNPHTHMCVDLGPGRKWVDRVWLTHWLLENSARPIPGKPRPRIPISYVRYAEEEAKKALADCVTCRGRRKRECKVNHRTGPANERIREWADEHEASYIVHVQDARRGKRLRVPIEKAALKVSREVVKYFVEFDERLTAEQRVEIFVASRGLNRLRAYGEWAGTVTDALKGGAAVENRPPPEPCKCGATTTHLGLPRDLYTDKLLSLGEIPRLVRQHAVRCGLPLPLATGPPGPMC